MSGDFGFKSRARSARSSDFGETMEDTARSIDQFLASIERRAFRMADIATNNPDDALELVQDAMLAFVRSYANKPAEQWKPLFYRVLQNRIIDWHRRSKVRNRWMVWLKREPESDMDPIQSMPDPVRGDADIQVGRDDATEAMVNALKKLPDRQQQAFILRAWEGMNVAATATAMGCSSGSVKTHYSRALTRLRKELEDFWP